LARNLRAGGEEESMTPQYDPLKYDPMTSQLLPGSQKTAVKRSLRLPLVVLAVLVAALFLEIRWLRSRAVITPSVFHQTPSGWKKMPTPNGYPISLRVSSGGTAWMLTWGPTGLSRWDGAAWQYYKDTDPGRRSSYIREFALDGEQVWVATEQGVLDWDGQKWHSNHDVTAGYGASIVAGGGEVWIIDSSGRLSHFHNGQWVSQKLVLPGVNWSRKKDAENPRLARTDDGTLWLMREGLWRWDGETWTQVTAGADKIEDAELIGAAGDRVWLSDAAGLRSLSMDGKLWTAYTNEQIGLGTEVLVYQAVSGRGRTLFATTGGVIEFDGSNWRKLTLPVAGAAAIHSVAAGDGLWVVGSQLRGSTAAFGYFRYLLILTPLAILGVFGWIISRSRSRQLQTHQRVTQAVEHATGEVPEELEAGARRLKSRGWLGTGFVWIGSIVGYVLLRRVWPKVPTWIIPAMAITIQLLLTFQESLVKRKPKPWDPIGPGAPSRYNWAKSWKAVAGAVAVLLLLNFDRLPILRFLRGYWFWILVVGPSVYHAVALHLQNRAAKRGDYDRALNIIRWAYFYNPTGTEPSRRSGHMLLAAGRYREAEDALRRSLASSHARESYGFALEYLGEALMEQGRHEEAMRSYEAALHAFPHLKRPYRGMAEMLLRRGEKPELALEYIEKIIDFSGLSRAQRAMNGKPQDDYWVLKAWALARLGRTSEVAEAIENAVRTTDKNAAPDMASTHYRGGMALQAMGNESAANEHFKLAVQFDPHGRRGTLAKAAMRETSIWGLAKGLASEPGLAPTPRAAQLSS
jgi:tetratricopeptide (TPR) repeat protein